MRAVDALHDKLKSLGWRGIVLPFGFRDAATRTVAALHQDGKLDESLYRNYLAPMLEPPASDSLEPRSIILIARPSYPVRLHFTLNGKPVAVTAAPGYLRGAAQRPSDVVNEVLAPLGFSAEGIDCPQKTLATISGFARYGRNNITYVEGLGSFHALVTLVSDLPCNEVPVREQEALPQCETCGACRTACPTGAIAHDRFLLHAERCITFWNEQEADVPFPEWIKRDWHNALFGCLHCQRACPENRPYLGLVHEGPTVDEATTRLLLERTRKEDMPESILPVLAPWRLDVLAPYLPRNLGILVERVGATGRS